MLRDPQLIVEKLRIFHRTVRAALVQSRSSAAPMSDVRRASTADTIYHIDAAIDPLLEQFCAQWSDTTPLVLVAEGLEDADGIELTHRVFPRGAREDDAIIRVIVDPIDGTRGLMYDKRPAWSLTGVAPNKGSATKLSDIEVAVMTELPTSKMGCADTLWAIRGQGAAGVRTDLRTGEEGPLQLRPSRATGIDHGFAAISNFFPGTKVLASEVMEHLVRNLIGPTDVTRATVFDDQYISTGGQFYELIVGHDRFNADLRPIFYRQQQQPEGLCCHPYDCAAMLIAQEAGVILTDGLGGPLDGPFDTTTGISWAAYANPTLQERIEPLLTAYLRELGA